MGLLDKIKSIFRKTALNMPVEDTSEMIQYDTGFIFIPKYNDLNPKEQEQVDKYVSQINIEKAEEAIKYGESLYEKSMAYSTLFQGLLNEITESVPNFVTMTEEEKVRYSVNNSIDKEKLTVYQALLQSSEQEAMLRTIALEEYKKKHKKEHSILGIFSKADRLQEKYLNEQISSSIERMKIYKHIIEEQVQIASEAKKDSEIIANSAEIISKLEQGDEETEEIKARIIEQEEKEVNKIAQALQFPEITGRTKIEKIANLQCYIDVYAYTHQREIPEIKKEVSDLIKEAENLDKEQLQAKISELETKYKIFKRYLKYEDLKALYEIKFKVETMDINKRTDSPFEGLEESLELNFYIKIMEGKIDAILREENENFKNAFTEEELSKALSIFKKLLKNGVGTINPEKILKDRNILASILAFDSEDGLSKLTMTKEELDRDVGIDLKYDFIKWEDFVPIKSALEYRKIFYDSKPEKPSILAELYMETKDYNSIGRDTNPNEIILPEGIEEILAMHRDNAEEKIIRSKKIVCPSTLKRIGDFAFHYCYDLEEIMLNEGLIEIGYRSFTLCRNLKQIICPSTLRIIGNIAFGECDRLEKVMLNEGLREIKDASFEMCKNLKEINFPSTLKKIGNCAFANCKSLEQIDLPSSLERVGTFAFGRSINMKQVKLNKKRTIIGEYAFPEHTIIEDTSTIKKEESEEVEL